mgnify:CR=1 FL=1
MGKFFSMLLEKITAVIAWFSDLAVAVFKAAWDLAKDVICWPIDQFLSIIVGLLQDMQFDAITSNLGVWSSMPAEIINVLGLLGVGSAWFRPVRISQ